uniref:Ankyrin repeat domain-containing protein n=1 Tax=Haptolina brevifila TaxID=156173 RepID=A0A7S2I468_9EUKA|mmetsp:Transcript_6151/g.12784  ORF Transcript_6151/g.12784 Transcript_6151/m.12784 type:complete len:259 (+) Transcript_6151:159-935(+)|eukprot:CAMPEP_0174707598 /NCGR_PEP_ID=MMETSP1094-20130205/10072_1 /TAXON_ID=156173 /ORGANISM="Chrysochromulina brevifilum, Strain UTEX LB 985" /LENGTH=258 /DNA_ID=CAMNT_0015906005 /DNA_START=151 /DNA_END=927 /DNA_ORIENTATION=-
MSDPAKALWSALLNNKNEELSHILQDGADPNMKGGEYEAPPIHFAAEEGNLVALGMLLTAGADVDAIDRSGATALHAAVRYNRVDIARQLVVAGADISIADVNGWVAMDYGRATGYNTQDTSPDASPGASPDASPMAAYQNPDLSSIFEEAQTPEGLRRLSKAARKSMRRAGYTRPLSARKVSLGTRGISSSALSSSEQSPGANTLMRSSIIDVSYLTVMAIVLALLWRAFRRSDRRRKHGSSLLPEISPSSQQRKDS